MLNITDGEEGEGGPNSQACTTLPNEMEGAWLRRGHAHLFDRKSNLQTIGGGFDESSSEPRPDKPRFMKPNPLF
ncbi:hypothetical protein EYF80_041045 [Liparis tanakae]|uniref:Uncharacterized protein n=1 Tax=Liparis tanakae TaxID=230148 RepID=A0A4Z2G662_9TELE|nr:hypothetical protein EYF80_041045 [Liparis tanakae]